MPHFACITLRGILVIYTGGILYEYSDHKHKFDHVFFFLWALLFRIITSWRKTINYAALTTIFIEKAVSREIEYKTSRERYRFMKNAKFYYHSLFFLASVYR